MIAVEVAAKAGISYRQLDYWSRCGFLRPEGEVGTGHPRDYPAAEVAVAVRMGRLVRAGLTATVAAKVARGDAASVEQLRQALEAS